MLEAKKAECEKLDEESKVPGNKCMRNYELMKTVVKLEFLIWGEGGTISCGPKEDKKKWIVDTEK